VLAAAALSMAAAPAARAEGWGGSITGTTDFVVRGLTQTQNEPTLIGDIHYNDARGWYGGIWVAGVRIDPYHPKSAEVTGYLGRQWRFRDDWSLNTAFVHYDYPWTTDRAQYNYDEATATVAWSNRVSASVIASPDAAADTQIAQVRGRVALAYELALHQPLPRPLGAASINAGAGYDDLRWLFGTGYVYWNAGVAYDFGVFQLDLSYIGTNGVAKSLFYDGVTADRGIATLTWRF
jgi:uncharacterized protein (TIGR02001 family)